MTIACLRRKDDVLPKGRALGGILSDSAFSKLFRQIRKLTLLKSKKGRMWNVFENSETHLRIRD